MLYDVNNMVNLLGDEIFGKINNLEWIKRCIISKDLSVCEECGK